MNRLILLAGFTVALTSSIAAAQIAVIALENKVVLDNGVSKVVANPRIGPDPIT